MTPAKLKVLVEKGKMQEGWTSAADIVREMEGEREMTLQWKGREGDEERRRGRWRQGGDQICRKHVFTVKQKGL